MVADAERVLAADGATASGFARISPLLQRLARHLSRDSATAMAPLHGSGSSFVILTEGKQGTALMLASFPPDAPTPVHDHGTWGLACVVQGRDRHIRWKRLDDGTAPGRAQVQAVEDRMLGPGDVVAFGPPPDDIHSQQGVGETAYELVYFGSRPALERHYFDPSAGTVTVDLAAPAPGRPEVPE